MKVTDNYSLEWKDIDEGFSRLHADKVFLGVRGIDLLHGLTDTDTRRIVLKQVMIQASQQVIVVADSRKIGKPSLIDIAPLNVVNSIVTDEGIEPALLDELRNKGVQVYIAQDIH